MFQWLLQVPSAGDLDSILSQGTLSDILQLRVRRLSTKIEDPKLSAQTKAQCSQGKKERKMEA